MEEVPVGGHDHGLDPTLVRSHGQRSDRVVGLVILDPQDRDLQGGEDLVDQPQLRTEISGCFAPSGLVLGVHLKPHGRRAHVEGHDDQVGSLLSQELDQHRREPVDRVRDLTGAGRERRRKREERPVREAVAVEQEEPG